MEEQPNETRFTADQLMGAPRIAPHVAPVEPALNVVTAPEGQTVPVAQPSAPAPAVDAAVPPTVEPANAVAPTVTRPEPRVVESLPAVLNAPAPAAPQVPAPMASPEQPHSAAVPQPGMRGIALANQKGGVAKTTTTLNLAVAFAEEGHRVLCIDMDPQGNLTMSQGLDPDELTESMYNVLLGQMPIRLVRHRLPDEREVNER
jgi:hypothetical protein